MRKQISEWDGFLADSGLIEGVFDKLTPEAAYWIGFLMADGNVCKVVGTSLRIQVGLKESDRDHLVKLARFVNTPNKISGLYYGCVKLAFASNRIAAKLASYGVVQRKTGIEEVADARLLFDRDFWRGVIDGDGSIYLQKRKGNGWRLVLALYGASEKLLEQFLAFARKICPDIQSTVRHGRDSLQLHINGRFAFKVLHVLYEDSRTSLDRKKRKADQILRMTGLFPNGCVKKLSENSVREIRRLRKLGTTYKQAAKKFGVAVATVQKIVNRKTWKHVA